MKLVLTCEHAGNLVPTEYQQLFTGSEKILQTHRAYDPGALDLFYHLKGLACFSEFLMLSRLIIEANRSDNHPQLFSEFSEMLAPEKKRDLINNYYLPYRERVEVEIKKLIGKGEKVCHISVHTFTPELNGKIRDTDLGLLFDPSRVQEKEFCVKLKAQLEKTSSFKICFNEPYQGISDGFTTALRQKFKKNYLGIELEINQKFVDKNTMDPDMKKTVYNSLQKILDSKSI